MSEHSAPGWWPRSYQATWLRSDLVAGLSTAAVVIPQSMAYAGIAGLPVEVGLFSASVPMAAYALAGTSRPLSVSVSSSIAAVTAVAVAGSPDPAAAATTMALFSGLFLIAAWLLRLGFVADLISAPVLVGFKIGIGITIAVGQLDSLLGVTVSADRVSVQLWQAISQLPRASGPTVLLSALCVAALLVGKRWLPRVPMAIVVVVATILAVVLGGLTDRGIALVGPVPSGFPLPSLPSLAGSLDLLGPALGVALISFVESIAAARAFQSSSDRPVEASRELGALGLANVVSALFRGMPAGGGMSQTAVNDGAGARSQLAAVITAATVVVTLLFLAPVFSDLPSAALGALVFVAAIGLVDVTTLRTIFSVHRRDGILALVAAAAVIAFGALDGILAAVLISALTLLYESSRRPIEVLDVVPVTESASVAVPAEMLIIRPRGDIYFANVHRFRREVETIIATAPVRPTVVLFDGSRATLFEYTAHQALRELSADLHRQGIEVWVVFPTGAFVAAVERFRRAFPAEGVQTFEHSSAAVQAFLDRSHPRPDLP